MVKDRYNEYYTNLYKALAVTYSDLSKTTQLSTTPSSFPCMYFRRIGGSMGLTTLSGTSDERKLSIEVQFFAKKLSDARKLSELAIEFMVETEFFTCTLEEQIENAEDTSIYRYVTRFEKLDV